MKEKEVFIIGAKGIPARYGGFESFVEQLTLGKKSPDIHYNVACRRDLSKNKSDFYEYNCATCFNVDVPNVGAAKAILYDVRAFKKSLNIIEQNNIQDPIIYVLACRIGPFIAQLKSKLKKYNGKLFVNPDGHEWLRAKWSYPVRKYWKLSEKLMVKHADLLICDSKNIETYIRKDYHSFSPKTKYIAYGSDLIRSGLRYETPKVKEWFEKNKIIPKEYFLIVGRFVPENNFEIMIREFMKTNIAKDLVVVTNVERNKFYKYLLDKTNFISDERIKFVGTVYDTSLLKFIRENAVAYLHGHEVGGTNPSLLEALGSTSVNMLLDVGFNREVGVAGAIYWTKETGVLKNQIESVARMHESEIHELGRLAKLRVIDDFNWSNIVDKYEDTFQTEVKK